jgi:type II restriction/modification system DNA methylase subunit YeeA
VVGNPPFVGDKKMRAELGDAYTEALRAAYKGRVPGGADLVCYWFERARQAIAEGRLQRAGLVSTNSIRGGRNREVLDAIVKQTRIFEAWSDEPWVNDGAAVRVSLVAFGESSQPQVLNGSAVAAINSDLTSQAADLTSAARLSENRSGCFYTTVKAGSFDVAGELARAWLALPNPNRRSNSDVVRPWMNAMDMTRRNADKWVVDFGCDMALDAAMLYEAPFAHVLANVKPERDQTRRERYRTVWWQFAEPIPGLRTSLKGVTRFVATPAVSKHRLFAWISSSVVPDHALMAITRADDTTFGLLHSRLHELWSLRLGTSLEDRPRYTPTTCFETFPFPAGLTPADTAHQRTEPLAGGSRIPADLPPPVRAHAEAIAQAAHRLVALRDAWLNPPEWTERVPEVVPLGLSTSPYPDRIVARAGFEAELAKRTLTNLYNQRPTWLAQAHEALDAAVAAAYGWADWTAQLPDDEILRRLLALNRERAGAS